MTATIIQKPDMGKKVTALTNPPTSIFRDITLNMLSRMRDRIRKGKDHNNRNFEKYSYLTKTAKLKMGRDSTVNMTNRGTMIRGLESKCTNKYGDIYLGAEQDIGYRHQRGVGVPRREWFGYTKDNAEKAREEYGKYVRKALKK